MIATSIPRKKIAGFFIVDSVPFFYTKMYVHLDTSIITEAENSARAIANMDTPNNSPSFKTNET